MPRALLPLLLLFAGCKQSGPFFDPQCAVQSVFATVVVPVGQLSTFEPESPRDCSQRTFVLASAEVTRPNGAPFQSAIDPLLKTISFAPDQLGEWHLVSHFTPGDTVVQQGILVVRDVDAGVPQPVVGKDDCGWRDEVGAVTLCHNFTQNVVFLSRSGAPTASIAAVGAARAGTVLWTASADGLTRSRVQPGGALLTEGFFSFGAPQEHVALHVDEDSAWLVTPTSGFLVVPLGEQLIASRSVTWPTALERPLTAWRGNGRVIAASGPGFGHPGEWCEVTRAELPSCTGLKGVPFGNEPRGIWVTREGGLEFRQPLTDGTTLTHTMSLTVNHELRPAYWDARDIRAGQLGAVTIETAERWDPQSLLVPRDEDGAVVLERFALDGWLLEASATSIRYVPGDGLSGELRLPRAP